LIIILLVVQYVPKIDVFPIWMRNGNGFDFITAREKNHKLNFFRAAASSLAAALLLSAGAPSAWALRDVISNQPAIPDTIVPGKTSLQGSGAPSEIQSGGAFVMDFGGGSKVIPDY
jgi:hypothetical protein